MKVKRQIITKTEIERTFSIKLSKFEAHLYCQTCGYKTKMISINKAVNFTKKNWREIITKVETGNLHSMETSNGEIYICSVSLGEVMKFHK